MAPGALFLSSLKKLALLEFWVADLCPRAISDTVSEELESDNEWLVDNRLLLHLGETETILLGTKKENEEYRRL